MSDSNSSDRVQLFPNLREALHAMHDDMEVTQLSLSVDLNKGDPLQSHEDLDEALADAVRHAKPISLESFDRTDHTKAPVSGISPNFGRFDVPLNV